MKKDFISVNPYRLMSQQLQFEIGIHIKIWKM